MSAVSNRKFLYFKLYINNLSKAIVSTDLFADYSSPTFVRWHYKTANTPYKAGLTYGQEGFALVFGSVSGWHTVISWLKGGGNMWAHYVSAGTDYGWSEYAQKSDLYPSYDQITLFSDVKADVTNKSITITENGMVQATAKTQATEAAAFIRLIINGNTVYEGHTVSGKYRYLWTPIFPVKKGDIIKVTLETGTSDGQRFVYFYKS